MHRAAFLLLFVLLGPKNSVAQVSIQITVRSHHFAPGDFTEWNLGIGIGYDVGPGAVEVGLYRNSNGDPSVYQVFTRKGPEGSKAGGLIGIGGVLGYPGGPRPLLIPGAYVSNNPRLRVLYAPPPGNLFFSQVAYGAAPGQDGSMDPGR